MSIASLYLDFVVLWNREATLFLLDYDKILFCDAVFDILFHFFSLRESEYIIALK